MQYRRCANTNTCHHNLFDYLNVIRYDGEYYCPDCIKPVWTEDIPQDGPIECAKNGCNHNIFDYDKAFFDVANNEFICEECAREVWVQEVDEEE